VSESLQRLDALVKSRGLTVFAHIDFSVDAAKAGLRMPATQLLIFGNPKSGTPLMMASPSIALDLPLKALASEDAQGKVRLSDKALEYLRQRHGRRNELLNNISGVGTQHWQQLNEAVIDIQRMNVYSHRLITMTDSLIMKCD
jgi:uncharacterized protein (DUF302 family)